VAANLLIKGRFGKFESIIFADANKNHFQRLSLEFKIVSIKTIKSIEASFTPQ